MIAARYAEFETIGLPEIRDVDPEARCFTPFRDERSSMDNSVANVGRVHAINRPKTRWSIPVCGIAS